MRFLIDAHHLGLRQTGNETWCRNVLRHLDGELGGHELHVAVTEQGLTTLKSLTDSRHHVVSVHPTRRVAVDLPALAARERIDAVLAQYTVAPSRAASVVMIHDLSPLDAQSHEWLSLRFRLRFRASLALSTRVASVALAPSEFTRRQIIETYGIGPGRVRVAPNAIDDELGAMLDSARRRTPPVATVLSVGNVLPRKNLITVARAVRRLRAKGLAIHYRVVGQVGAGGTAIGRQLRALVPDIEITGYVTQEQLAHHYLSASVLAFPSLFEGYGLPLIEAMRARLPVICSSRAALPEIAAGACAVLPPLDVDAWAAAIERLVTVRAERTRASRRGTARAGDFDWRATARVVADSLVTAGAAGRG